MTAGRISRRTLGGGVATLVLSVALATVALAFAWPWLPRAPAGGAALERYAPQGDGDSLLIKQSGPDGEPASWESRNLAVVPGLRAFTELRPATREALQRAYENPEELEGSQVIESRSRKLGAGGKIAESTDVLVREPRGLFSVGYYDAQQEEDFIFDPPVLLLPADLGPDSKWESEGRFSGSLDYRVSGRVTGSEPYEDESGDFDDCLEVETRLVLSRGDEIAADRRLEDRYCAGAGLVESREFGGDGELAQHSVTVAATGRALAEPGPMPPALSAEDAASGDPSNWELSRVGGVRPTGETAEGTIPPTYVPTDPPVLLAAGHGGDLLAFDAAGASGDVLWRFHPGGTVYGAPAFDPEAGRVYFGASDKKLYALDARGLFLWSFETGDNVAARPVVVGDTVVFGSEDYNVYGLDATTGRELWSVETGGPVVSSAVVAGEIVVIGSDDGGVYGLDPTTGDERWLYVTEGAVEAPIVEADGILYVADREGGLTTLDPVTGEEVWVADMDATLRTAPAVGESAVFVVDQSGRLSAFDREKGRELWSTGEQVYTGPPVLVGETLIVAGTDGKVYRFGFDGERRGEWDASDASIPTDGAPVFRLGAARGDEAVWLADDSGVVRRLGPAIASDPRLELIWATNTGGEPFGNTFLFYTPAEYGGEALLLDYDNNVYAVDPATGDARRLGAIPADAPDPVTGPVVAGDTLLAAAGDTLYATNLPDVDPLWQFTGRGASNFPAIVSGDTVLWLTAQQIEGSDRASGTLHALDLDTGQARWEASVEGFNLPGGVLVRDGTVFTGTPPAAFDLETGKRLWESAGEEPAVGGPALNDAGDVLFVGSLGPDGSTGFISALDASDGGEIWRVSLGDEALDSQESPRVVGDVLIVPLLSGDVLALDPATGEEIWRYEPPVARLGLVTVEGDRIWLALQDGGAVVLDAASGEPIVEFDDLDLNLDSASFAQRPLVVGDRAVVAAGLWFLGYEVPEEVP